MALPQKSVLGLEEVSTTCDSGWVRSRADRSARGLRTHPLSQVVLTVSKPINADLFESVIRRFLRDDYVVNVGLFEPG